MELFTIPAYMPMLFAGLCLMSK